MTALLALHRIFLTLTETFNFEQHVSVPTHNKGHILDSFFSLGLDISHVTVQDVHLSDHFLVSFDLHFDSDPTPLEVRCQRRVITANSADRFCEMFDSSLLTGCIDVEILLPVLTISVLKLWIL